MDDIYEVCICSLDHGPHTFFAADRDGVNAYLISMDIYGNDAECFGAAFDQAMTNGGKEMETYSMSFGEEYTHTDKYAVIIKKLGLWR